MLLWSWGRQAAAALIRPLTWELPYAEDAALKTKPKKKKKKRENLKEQTGLRVEDLNSVSESAASCVPFGRVLSLSGFLTVIPHPRWS